MLRFLASFCALLIGVGLLLADEYQGKFKSVTKDKMKITVTVDGVDKTFTVSKDPLVINEKNKAVPKGVLGIKAGSDVKISTDKKDDKETATTIRVLPDSK
jgi:hypothetical protein